MARDFRDFVGKLTAEDSVELLETLVPQMEDVTVMDVLGNVLTDDMKEELHYRWAPKEEPKEEA
jgi:hypothetical protein